MLFPFCALFITFLSPIKATTLYSLKDLTVLEQEKNFEEFLLHVNDIRPSERQKLWREMYQSMSLELIDYKIKTKDFSLETFKRIEQLAKSNALINDEYFQFKRSIYAKKFFTDCYALAKTEAKTNSKKNNIYKSCEDELSSFWYFSKKDADIGLDLASLIDNHPGELNSWTFYQTAIKDSAAPIYCEKPNVQNAIIKKLTSETFDREFNGNYPQLITRFIPEKCFNKLIPTLKDLIISSGPTGIEKELAFNILTSKKHLTFEDEAFYAIIFLIDQPVVGEKMNFSWKIVEKLSSQYNLRIKILSKIKMLETLPDKIMVNPQNNRNKAIINLFSRSFPEFLDYYAKSCIDYLEFKNNQASQLVSSYQCHEFLKAANRFKASEKIDWISEAINLRYSAIKK